MKKIGQMEVLVDRSLASSFGLMIEATEGELRSIDGGNGYVCGIQFCVGDLGPCDCPSQVDGCICNGKKTPCPSRGSNPTNAILRE